MATRTDMTELRMDLERLRDNRSGPIRRRWFVAPYPSRPTPTSTLRLHFAGGICP